MTATYVNQQQQQQQAVGSSQQPPQQVDAPPEVSLSTLTTQTIPEYQVTFTSENPSSLGNSSQQQQQQQQQQPQRALVVVPRSGGNDDSVAQVQASKRKDPFVGGIDSVDGSGIQSLPEFPLKRQKVAQPGTAAAIPVDASFQPGAPPVFVPSLPLPAPVVVGASSSASSSSAVPISFVVNGGGGGGGGVSSNANALKNVGNGNNGIGNFVVGNNGMGRSTEGTVIINNNINNNNNGEEEEEEEEEEEDDDDDDNDEDEEDDALIRLANSNNNNNNNSGSISNSNNSNNNNNNNNNNNSSISISIGNGGSELTEAERARNAGLQVGRANVGQVNSVSGQDQKYVEITDYLTLPQSTAAGKLGLPPSTFSKRWKEAACGRKWPYRAVAKIDKEILTLLHNIPHDSTSGKLPEEIENTLSLLMKKRQEELKPVFIRI